jgi:hypothetical protein
MTTFLTSAVTRGSVRSSSSTEGFPFDPWTFDVRDGNGGFFSAAVNTNNTAAINVRDTYTSGLDITTRICARYFLAFNTSSITESVTSAALYIFKQTAGLGNGDFMPVKATAPTTSTNITTADYNAIFQYETGYAMDSNTFGNVVDYADLPTLGTVNGWNAVTLNAAACTDINTLTEFKLALVNYTYDYLYQEPTPGSPGTNVGNGINAASNPPYLEIETGLGQYVLSINPDGTTSVNFVPKATIRLVNRVGAYTFFRATTGGANDSSNPGCQIPFPGTTPLYCVKPYVSLQVGDFVFNDYTLASPFNGGSNWWALWFRTADSSWTDRLYRISNTGEITTISTAGACLF